MQECPLLVELPCVPGCEPDPGTTGISKHPTATADTSKISDALTTAGTTTPSQGADAAGPKPDASEEQVDAAAKSPALVFPKRSPSTTRSWQDDGHPKRHFFCISPDACTNPTFYVSALLFSLKWALDYLELAGMH